MTEDIQKPGKAFWIVGILLLLWGLVGIYFYITEMTMADDAYLETYGQLAADLRAVVPTWSVAGYAIGVWVGLLGAILLLLRKAWAVPAYLISLLGAIAAWAWYLINPEALKLMKEQSGWVMLIIVFVLCIFSLWWARRQKANGILR